MKDKRWHILPNLDGEMYLVNPTAHRKVAKKLAADINIDNVINILDLVRVASAFGDQEPDLNGDGIVNIQDLVMVAISLGVLKSERYCALCIMQEHDS